MGTSNFWTGYIYIYICADGDQALMQTLVNTAGKHLSELLALYFLSSVDAVPPSIPGVGLATRKMVVGGRE